MRNLEQGTVLFSRYKIMDLLGSGGSGCVYLAENMRIGNLVAIKAVDKKDSQMNLIAEKDLLKELRHSAIPIIVDTFEDEERYYLIEEYVEGTLLGSLKLQLSEDEMQDIMLQLCDVLLYLHTSFEEPIIFRDLKPDNIIRMNNGRIKLIDFGIAVRHSEISQNPKVHYGTKGYSAPEQLSYFKSDEKTDIYALGVSIYYMLTGKNLSQPPYRLRPIREINPEISVEFAEIISKCIETLPVKRYQNIRQIIYELKTIGQAREGEQDYLTFREKSHLLITCAGLKQGMGATHMTFLLAHHFKEQGKKVGLVEWQDRDDFIKMASIYEEVEEGRYFFEFHGTDCYFYTKNCDYNKAIDQVYDVLIIDAGHYEEMEMRGSYELTDEVLLLCGSKDWEIDYFEEVIFSKRDKKVKYLFNHTDNHAFKRIHQQVNDVMCYQVPYNPNPYVPEAETRNLFGKLFVEVSPIDKPDRRTIGIGGLNEAKKIIENHFKRLAKE